MDIKKRVIRTLSRTTCDKIELNRQILKWKKHFDEAKNALGKQKVGRKKSR